MIICKMCGNNNADADEFCGNCGKFLEWTGEHVVVPETITVIEEPPPEAPEAQPRGWRRLLKKIRDRWPSYTIEPRTADVPTPTRPRTRRWARLTGWLRRKPAYVIESVPMPSAPDRDKEVR